jgi:hypothetical protein
VFSAARPAGACAIVEAENRAMRGANQLATIDQESPRRVVQAAALMGTGVAPGEKWITPTIKHDRFEFAGDEHI